MLLQPFAHDALVPRLSSLVVATGHDFNSLARPFDWRCSSLPSTCGLVLVPSRKGPYMVRPPNDTYTNAFPGVMENIAQEWEWQDDTSSDEESDYASPASPRAPLPTDYFMRLSEDCTAQHVLGVVTETLNILGELWEEGQTELVEALASFLANVDLEAEGPMVSMSIAVVRRYTRGYLLGHGAATLSPYWQPSA